MVFVCRELDLVWIHNHALPALQNNDNNSIKSSHKYNHKYQHVLHIGKYTGWMHCTSHVLNQRHPECRESERRSGNLRDCIHNTANLGPGDHLCRIFGDYSSRKVCSMEKMLQAQTTKKAKEKEIIVVEAIFLGILPVK